MNEPVIQLTLGLSTVNAALNALQAQGAALNMAQAIIQQQTQAQLQPPTAAQEAQPTGPETDKGSLQ